MASISKIITSQPSLNNLAKDKPVPSIKITRDVPVKLVTASTLLPDKVVISKESQEKNADETKHVEENIPTQNKETLKLTPEQKAKLAEKAEEKDLDEIIQELSVKIMEMSLQIEQLKNKEDTESVKERKALEVELAITKGRLEAKLQEKLDTAKLS
jgi:hypothetical protein